MGKDDESASGDEEGDSPKGPPRGPPKGPPMGTPMGMVPGMFPTGAAPPQRSGGPVPIPTPTGSHEAASEGSAPEFVEVAESPIEESDEPDEGDAGITDFGGAIATAMAASH